MEEMHNFPEHPEFQFNWSEIDIAGREQSVVIYFNYGIEDDEPFFNLGEKLNQIMEDQNLGEYDGHEMELDNRDGSYYLYGPSAEKIFKAVKPCLEEIPFMKGAIAVLRFGRGEDAPMLEVEIS